MRHIISGFLTSILVFVLFQATGQTVDESGGLNPPAKENKILYFQLVPSNSLGSNEIDALFTLSEGPVTTYGDCSAILRFNNLQTSPYLDVHDGGYIRTNNVAITLDATYHCWFEINFAAQTYSTYVLTGSMASPTLVHAGASFRKTGVGSLALWSSVHTGSSNVLEVKNTGFVDAVGEYAVDWLLLATAYGTLDEESKTISDIPPGTSLSDFAAGLSYTESATLQILDGSGNPITLPSTSLVASDMKVKITGVESSEYTLQVREVSSAADVLSAFNASISTSAKIISNLYNDLTLVQFKGGLIVSDYATFKVVTSTGEEITDNNAIIAPGNKVEVTAEDGSVKLYSIFLGEEGMPATTFENSTTTFHQVAQEKMNLGSNVNWHIKSATDPLPGSILNIQHEDVWVYFDNIRPQTFFDNYLGQIRVNGEMPEVDVNVRLVQYGNGCVLIGHPASYTPLTIYADANLSGASMDLGLYTFYKTVELGELADNAESFVLKKGYMATFAENTGGTGNSQVYIAHKEDIVINQMPAGLTNNVSFVRVVPWRWTTKKSFAEGNYDMNESLNCTWRYNWDNSAQSTLNIEYVPMRHNPNWPAYSNIVNKKNVTHALHFNEPDNSVDDGYATVDEAIAQWPQMLASGLRLGSPAPTDGGVQWLYDFIDACAANNYRVDFVAIHFYRGGQTTANFYNFLKAIHDRTGLPIWITEWNNGANWTCCDPTYASQAETINDWVDMLEAAPFVERYALYGNVEATRDLFYDGSATNFTPAGKVYRDKVSALAYNPGGGISKNPYPADEAKELSPRTILSWNPGPASSAQQLYFGESSPPEFKASMDGRTDQFDLGELEFNKTYHWRVDEYNGNTWVAGEEWEFSTISFMKPYDPSPASGATEVNEASKLSWSSDSIKTETHWLYMGTSSDDLTFQVTLTDNLTEFDPEKLSPNQTYYWRVDEHLRLKSGQEIILKGDQWSFTTVTVLGIATAPQFSVYPVPVQETVYIQGLKKTEKIKVFNLAGAEVLSVQSESTLHLGHLPQGTYIIRIEGYEPVKIVK